jgi:hypothetical protein
MAEIHGCGDEAKKKAREDWLHSNRPGGTVTGQSSTKPLKPQARNHLQSKLQVMPTRFPRAGVRLLIAGPHRKSWVGWRTRARSPRRRTRRVVGAAAQPDEEEAAPLVAEEAVGEAATLDRPNAHVGTRRA